MKRKISFVLCFLMLFFSFIQANAESNPALEDTVNYIYNTVSDPTVGSVGGEWAIIGLLRSDAEIPDEYYKKYYEKVENYVKECEGILHKKKYTEYSRVVLALTSIGKNPEDVAGYNLITPLLDFENTVWQGTNGAVWALIALDSGNYGTTEIREKYLNHILGSELSGGGFSLSSEDAQADTDITAMALTALAPYKSRKDVEAVIERGLSKLSLMQNEDGGFSNENIENSESTSQVLIALSALGISYEDERFVKNSLSALDALMSYKSDDGSFSHIRGSETNLMATEQAICALAAVKRFENNQNPIYSMSDKINIGLSENNDTVGLPEKHTDINVSGILYPGKVFSDTTSHKNEAAILSLAKRGIINGKSENSFEPESFMTRAEFAAIIVRGLGLLPSDTQIFDDVASTDWFYGYVCAAKNYNIVSGVSENEFNPHGTITKQEAAVMVARAAKLCGMDTTMQKSETRDILAGFIDYTEASSWAQDSLAFCYDIKILSDEDIEILPQSLVTRAKVAQMLYNMLSISKLI